MTALTSITLMINGLMLMLALGSLFIFVGLLQNSRRQGNVFFLLFMMAMIVWASGSFLGRTTAEAAADDELVVLGLRLLELGFAGATISIYLLATALTDMRPSMVWSMLGLGLITLVINQAILQWFAVELSYQIDDLLTYSFPVINGIIYFLFAGAIVFIVWRNTVKFKQSSMSAGLLLFGSGQIIALISPRLRALGFAEYSSTIAAVMIVYATVQDQVVQPLQGRTRQVEFVQEVGQAMTGRVRLDDVLNSIAVKAAQLLGVDACAIYLRDDEKLVLRAVHELPKKFIGTTRLALNEGLVGTVASEGVGQLLSNYRREWKGVPDMPLAFETFGAVVGMPLIFNKDVVGVLLLIEGRDGRLFDEEDMQRLELLVSQAAVAIGNSHLFEQELALTTQLATAKLQLETVLVSTTNPVVAVDRETGGIIFANPAAVSLLNIEDVHQGIHGRPLLELISRAWLPPDLRALVRDLRTSGLHVYEVEINQTEYLCHVTRMEEPSSGWVAVLNDVTSFKEIDRLKSKMMRMTTHDLKNPLFAIMTYLDLLKEDGEGLFTDSIRSNLEIISIQVDRMLQLVLDFLDLEKVESGGFTMELCDLREILLSALRGVEDMAHTKGLFLNTELATDFPPIEANSHHLGQALTNLLDNAIKFTPPGGYIWLRAYQEDNSSAIVSVEDTGIGIPLEEQDKVFERFYRAEKGRRKDDISSGLGLSLVKAVIESHNGEIWFRSEEQKGTTFYIRLPL